jgi:hypothetical protein
MRLSTPIIIVATIVTLIIVVVLGLLLVQPPQSLITSASFSPQTITPNADGSDDITVLTYALSRGAEVSIAFERADGTQFVFRQGEPRTAGDYSVLFSGVVDGYVNTGDTIEGEVLRRLMPDGEYTWRLTAVGANGETDERSGTLTLLDGEAVLPEIVEFSIYPEVFTPNQDGISDRTAINVGLSKEADLQVYLTQPGIEPIFIPERLEDFNPDQPSLRHYYDYEGGVDLGANPPPDGEYTVIALAQDDVGQQVQRSGTLAIQDGGAPFAQIVPQPSGATVIFEHQPYEERYFTSAEQRGDLLNQPNNPQSLTTSMITMPVGDLLVFALTVENYGDVAIRTAGSPPGTVYDWSQRAATFDEFDESGAWRVGIDCDTAMSDYPWRWRLGGDDDLVVITDPNDGETYYYLPAGARAVIWGAVRMTEIEARNPQNCWAGLIHEDVGISQLNGYVGPRRIELVDPSGENTPN